MGSDLTTDHYQGILIPDERVTNATITDRGAGNTDSVYTETGPRPGTPDPDQSTLMAIEGSGTQTAQGHLELLTKRAGNPGPEEAGVVWRDVANGHSGTGDTTSQYKGWDGPQVYTGWESLDYTVDPHPETWLSTIRLKSGKILTGTQFPVIAGSDDWDLWRYDPSDATWTKVSIAIEDVPGPTHSASPSGPGLVELPSGRVLFFFETANADQVDVMASDDEGDTWFLYATRVLDTPMLDVNDDIPTILGIRADYNNGQICLIVWYVEPDVEQNENLFQYASDDLGGHFTQVTRDFYTDVGDKLLWWPKVMRVPGGGFVLCGLRASGGFVYESRKVDSAYSPFAAANTVTVATQGAAQEIDRGTAPWLDENGDYYYLMSTGSTSDQALILARSTDFAETWTTFYFKVFDSTDQTVFLKSFDVASVAGRAFVVTRCDVNDPTPQGPSINVLELGGFTDQTVPNGDHDLQDNFQDIDFLAWGTDVATETGFAGNHIPFDLPTNTGWAIVSGANQTIIDPMVLQIDTATTASNASQSSATTADAIYDGFGVEIDAGDGSITSDEIYYEMRIGDGAAVEYHIQLFLKDDSFRLYDVNAAGFLGGTATISLKTFVRFRIILGQGNVIVWTATDAHAREWTEQFDETVSNGGAGNQSLVRFGHSATGTNTSRWSSQGFNEAVGRWTPEYKTDPWDSYTNPDDLHPWSLPTLPSGVHDGVKIRAASGPTRIAEVWQIRAEHDYGIENIDPRISPSPRARWRSADDDTEVKIVWERESKFTDGWWDNECFGIALINANFRTAYLEAWTGAAWSTLITLDTGTDWAFSYDREGRIFRPSATSRGGPYVWYNDLAGDTLLLQGDDGAALIERNTEGALDTDATIKLPMVVADNDTLDGTEAGSGTGRVHRRNYFALLFAQPTAYDFIRLRIPAQTTATGDFRLGAALIGGVGILGWQYDRGWQQTRIHNANLATAIDGTRRARNLGPSRRGVEFGWTETAVDATEMYLTDPKPDYVTGVAGGGGGPIASRRDTPRQVEGIIDRTQGPVVPVAMLGQITPQAEGAVYHCTDNTTWMYGRIVSDTSRPVILGDEGDGEVQQLEAVIVEAEV